MNKCILDDVENFTELALLIAVKRVLSDEFIEKGLLTEDDKHSLTLGIVEILDDCEKMPTVEILYWLIQGVSEIREMSPQEQADLANDAVLYRRRVWMNIGQS